MSHSEKIFCLGLSKTGTTSIGRLLEDMGYKVCHENMGDYEEQTANQLLDRMDKAVINYDAFQDSPWCAMYEHYKELFPDAKFILTVRSIPKWLNSMSVFSGKRIPIWEHVYGKQQFKGNEKYFESFFLKHMESIINTFSETPGRLLIVDIEADNFYNARAIEAFLAKKVNYDISFPMANKGTKNKVKWILKKLFFIK